MAVIPCVETLQKLSSLTWNRCPVCYGITVQFRVEWVSTLPWNTQAVFQKYLLLSLCLPFLWGAVEGFIEQDRAVQKLNALESHCVIQKFKNGGEVSRKTPECLWAVDGNRYLVWKETQGNKAIGVAIKHTLLGVCFSLIAGYFVQTYLLRVPVPNDSEIA